MIQRGRSTKFLTVYVEEERLPMKEMGNKAVLIVKSWLLGWAKSYCLIYVTFWKDEVISFRDACEEALLCATVTSHKQRRFSHCQSSALPSRLDAPQSLHETAYTRKKWKAVNWRNRNWRGKSRYIHLFSDKMCRAQWTGSLNSSRK